MWLNQLHVIGVDFDEKEYVTLLCEIKQAARQFEVDCTVDQFNKMLPGSGEQGAAIAEEFANRLSGFSSGYLEVGLITDRVLVVSGFDFVLTEVEPLEPDLFFKNPVKTYNLDKMYKSKRFTYGTVDYEEFINVLKPHSLKLTQVYKNYLNALDNGYNEYEARRMLGLDKPFVYDLAKELYYMWD